MTTLNETPSANRTHIGFFGRRNAGKSSVVNAVTGQEMSVVSDTLGTTTDPVSKSMELLPLGPVVILDTPGYDDEGALGELRVRRTRQVLSRADLAVLVVDATAGFGDCEQDLIKRFVQQGVPYLVAWNKCDLAEAMPPPPEVPAVAVSALTGEGIQELRERLARLRPASASRRLLADLVKPLDLVVLVIPIDESAPKGRLILPQQQALRDLLEAGAIGVTTRETELAETLKALGRAPAMVVTDSQAFATAAKDTPPEIPLTSFSILMARYKGFLETAVRGVAALNSLHDGDRVLIAEGCTHHRQCNDIGTVKIPRWLKAHTGCELQIETSSGLGFPEDLSPYRVVIHCGGCMLNEREVTCRMKCALDQGVPFLNYGIAIAYMKGILHRSLSLFPELQKLVLAHETR
ncbi:MAG: [Victivallales bacterium]|nr:[FeFe] hydrogenase H-cluster maturation GTPase HydF [Victivallales bacterium]